MKLTKNKFEKKIITKIQQKKKEKEKEKEKKALWIIDECWVNNGFPIYIYIYIYITL
jgi:hypothetical protein